MYLKRQTLFLAFLCTLGCNSATQDANTSKSIPDSLLVHTGTFEKALKEAGSSSRHLVAILSKKDCPPCEMLQEYVKKDFAIRRYANDYLFYLFDERSPSNWLNQCFYITASPTAIIFSPQGELETIISGARKDIYPKVLEGVISKDTGAMYAGSRTRAAIEGAALISVLRKSYQAHRYEKDTSVTSALEQAHAQYPYFYNAYQLSKRYALQGDSTKARLFAEKALSHNSPPELMLYQSQRNEMKALLHPDYDATKEPHITFAHNNMDLGTFPVQKKKEIVFTLKNTGHKPLRLKDVIVSCSCLSVEWPRKNIPPGSSGEIKATYNISKAGSFNQYAYVISNAVNSAELLTIKGRVN